MYFTLKPSWSLSSVQYNFASPNGGGLGNLRFLSLILSIYKKQNVLKGTDELGF